ncbi:MAG: alpha/beta hydrolase [Candidatus Eremiobacteraeota bacterium]|nr:alpha/beta hydrolase [Candidatus Eremiobacteraeota bacterium]
MFQCVNFYLLGMVGDMPFMPLAVLPMWILGLLSLALLLGGGYIMYEWWQGILLSTLVFAAGIAMLVLTLLGRFLVLAFHRRGEDDPSWARDGKTQLLERPDGTLLHVEISGPSEALPVILVHGWGVDNRAFYYTKRSLSARHRVITWDLRGLGNSSRGSNNDYSLDAMADDLAAIADLADAPAVILGHSIGGMIMLTFARRHADRLKSDVVALVLVATTYTDPTRTMLGASVMHTLERPLLRPLMYLTIALSPIVWAMNWLSYISGLQLLATALSGFTGAQTRGQLDFASRFFAKARPSVLARGMLAMFNFDETSSIGNIPVPVLIVPGNRDPVLLPQASERMASVIPQSTLVGLAPAKHMGLMERYVEFNAILAQFIDAHATVRVRRDTTGNPLNNRIGFGAT